MGVYATEAEVRERLARFTDVALPASGDDLEAMIFDAERAVDTQLGPYAIDPVTGRKLDPASLTAVQADALKRATVVAVGYLAQAGTEDRFGLDDAMPNLLVPLRGVGLATRIDAELAGHDLIARSGTVVTPVDVTSPA